MTEYRFCVLIVVTVGFSLMNVVLAAAKNATGSGRAKLVFDDRSLGLPWPLPYLDYGQFLIHGEHCVSELEKYDPKDTSVQNVAHQRHCQTVVQSMHDYLRKAKTFTVSPEVCIDVRTSLMGGPKTQKGAFGYTGQFRYRPGRDIRNQDYEGSKHSGVRRSQPAVRNGTSEVSAGAKDQNAEFIHLQAHNLGALIEKEFAKTLNSAELEYMNAFYAEKATRVGTLGLVCKYQNAEVAQVVKKIAQLLGSNDLLG